MSRKFNNCRQRFCFDNMVMVTLNNKATVIFVFDPLQLFWPSCFPYHSKNMLHKLNCGSKMSSGLNVSAGECGWDRLQHPSNPKKGFSKFRWMVLCGFPAAVDPSFRLAPWCESKSHLCPTAAAAHYNYESESVKVAFSWPYGLFHKGPRSSL